MSDVVEDLRTLILADATVSGITTSAFVNSVPAVDAVPYIWLRRSRVAYGEEVGEAPRIESTFIDVEAVSIDPTVADSLADAIAAVCGGTTGVVGDGTYAWVHVHDQYDDYIPRNIDADERLHVTALALEVVHG